MKDLSLGATPLSLEDGQFMTQHPRFSNLYYG